MLIVCGVLGFINIKLLVNLVSQAVSWWETHVYLQIFRANINKIIAQGSWVNERLLAAMFW